MTSDRPPSQLRAKVLPIRLLLFDVDGVLTDGSILLHPDGSESKRFHIRDGTALVLARRAGLLTGFLSARQSAASARRADQLGVPIVALGVEAKLKTYETILREHGLQDDEVAFMGDDLLDLPVLSRVGLSAAPADAVADVRHTVDWVSGAQGGQGAARELVELVLHAQERWAPALANYLNGRGA